MKISCLAFLFCITSAFNLIAQQAEISGKILSNNKTPIEFATIGLKETKFFTTSNSDGSFKLTGVPFGNYQLRISCSGFVSKEIPILVNQVTINLNEIELEVYMVNLPTITVKVFSKKLLDKENPVAIYVVNEKTIDRTSESNIIDVLSKNTPGLTSVKSGPNVSKPFIRGLGYNRVLTLYDGIRQEGQQWGDEHGIEVDAYDIQNAEVIKGPASLMFGTDALAGVVSLFPFKPKPKNGVEGRYISEFQSNNKLIGNGLRWSIVKNKWSFALRSSWRLASNYQNAIDGKVFNTNFNEKNISSFIGYATEKAILSINASFYDNQQGIPDGSRDSLTRQFTQQIFNGAADILELRPIVSVEDLNSYKIAKIHQHIQHFRLYSLGDFKLKKGSLDYSLGFQQNRRKEFNQPETPDLAGLSLRLNTANYHLKYSFPIVKNVETFLGMNGVYQFNENQAATSFTIPNYQLFDGGIFAYSKWKKNKFSICGGIRNDIRTINFDDFYVQNDSLTGFDTHVTGLDTLGATLQFLSYSKVFQGLSASIGLSYFINQKWTVKANIGRGFRAPNITEIASNGLDPGARLIYLGNRNFVSEFSLQEDIALLLNTRNFSGEISIFNNNIQNFIYLALVADSNNQPLVDAQGNRTYQYKQAKAHLYGFETWLAFHPEKIKGLTVNGSFSCVYGFNREEKYRNKGIQGEYLSLIPPARLLINAAYSFELKNAFLKSIRPVFEYEFNAKQNRYLAENNSETATPAYSLFNFQLALELKYFKSKTAQLQFQANNIFDTAFQSHLSRLKYFENYQQTPNNKRGIYSMGRNLCVKLILNF
ncbi:MAG: TonB-dependent receptor [Flavobacteriales bacterium]|nr:TonB-dependent receptor [Flavobacteriales bacterium]